MWNEMADGIVRGMMESDSVKRRKNEWTYEELDHTPFLFSSGYLDGLREQATHKSQFEGILNHMYRHDATEIPSYREVEKKIIDRYWR